MKFRKIVFYFLPLFLVFCTMVFASEAGVEHGSHESGWGTIDTYKLLNFIVLVSVLFVLLRKSVGNFFSQRIETLKYEISELENRKEDAKKELEEFQKKLSSLDEEVKTIVETYVEQGEKAREKILSEAKFSAEKLRSQAEMKIEQEFTLAKESLSKEIVEKSVLEAEKLIRKNINDEDQEKLIEEYIGKVVA
ncbi:MAG: ATP synthase F0 subunit B [Deltaproteobacteria bacterium]|nr:MAG: ATP synthase F0 subunit B [Deltaproteobacteria bacterium]